MTSYRNPGPYEFEYTLTSDNVAAFPGDVQQLYGVKGRVPVKVTFDGRVAYQGSMVRMKTPHHLILIRNDIREAINKPDGTVISIKVELDDAPRTIEVPDDLAAALKTEGLSEAFDKLAFTHRREHVMAILDAKQPDTRTRRIMAAIDMIKAKESQK